MNAKLRLPEMNLQVTLKFIRDENATWMARHDTNSQLIEINNYHFAELSGTDQGFVLMHELLHAQMSRYGLVDMSNRISKEMMDVLEAVLQEGIHANRE